jgi:hypothetical protein
MSWNISETAEFFPSYCGSWRRDEATQMNPKLVAAVLGPAFTHAHAFWRCQSLKAGIPYSHR